MKPETRTVNDLFERDVRYVVPLYQRPYVWTEDEQWEPLWGDLQVLLDHQSQNGAHPSTLSHFLGAIVLEQETQAPGRIPLYTVIDGQQRLTTLQLLLAAARTVADEFDAATESGLLTDLVINDARKADGDERLKVWPTNINRNAFRAVLIPDPAQLAEDDPSNLIQEAFGYFVAKIREWVFDSGGDQLVDRLTTLRVTLADLVKVVSITLEPGDNAQIIFETLNARGTPLLALDLVKNAVFHEAARQGRDVDRLHEEVWKPQLELEHWRDERRQGRLKRAQGELFLMHWLGMKLQRVTPATELFTTFRREILAVTPAPDMAALIRELNANAATYASFDSQPAGSIERHFFGRLEALDVTTVMPLVLLLFTHPAVSVARRRQALRYLESWLVRRMLLRLTTKNYNKEIADLLGKVSADPERVDEVIRDQLLASTADASRWPEDSELIKILETRDMYYSIPQPRIVLILKGIELSLYGPEVDLPELPLKLSIEHVMPQQWTKNWGLPAIEDSEERALRVSERNSRINRLGNLTLTTIELNTDMSNRAWPKKQPLLNKGSKLFLNTELLEDYPDVFDDASIDLRTRVLARRVCDIWPRPALSTDAS